MRHLPLPVALILGLSSTGWAGPPDEDVDEAPGAPLEKPTDDDDDLQLGPLDAELRDLLLGDDDKVENPLEDITFITAGRLRLELVDADVLNDQTLAPLFVVSGRAGLSLPLGDHRVTVVLGDGIRMAEGINPSQPPALNPLYEVKLDLSLGAFGQPATLSLGRMRTEIADGRFLGLRLFRPRFGETYDGASLQLPLGPVVARGVAFYLGPYDGLDAQRTSFVTAVDVAYEDSFFDALDVEATGYGFAHKDGTPARQGVDPVNAGTVGSRLVVRSYGVTAAAGLDGQVQVRDENLLSPAGQAVHAEASLGYALKLSVFGQDLTPRIEAAAETTAGTPVAGRVMRTPNGNIHPYLGNLDLFNLDNLTAGTLLIGAAVTDRLSCDLSVIAYFLSDPTGPLIAANGSSILAVDQLRQDRFVGTELNGTVSLRLHDAIALVGQYGIIFFGNALPGRPVTQRLTMWIAFEHDVGGR